MDDSPHPSNVPGFSLSGYVLSSIDSFPDFLSPSPKVTPPNPSYSRNGTSSDFLWYLFEISMPQPGRLDRQKERDAAIDITLKSA